LREGKIVWKSVKTKKIKKIEEVMRKGGIEGKKKQIPPSV